jgi:hypothetical protein
MPGFQMTHEQLHLVHSARSQSSTDALPVHLLRKVTESIDILSSPLYHQTTQAVHFRAPTLAKYFAAVRVWPPPAQ